MNESKINKHNFFEFVSDENVRASIVMAASANIDRGNAFFDDIVSESILLVGELVLRKNKRFESPGHAISYIRKTIRSVLRAHWVERAQLIGDGEEVIPFIVDESLAVDAYEQAVFSELCSVLKKALDSVIRDNQKNGLTFAKAFVMRYFEGFIFEEISDELSVPLATAQYLVQRSTELVIYKIKKYVNSDY